MVTHRLFFRKGGRTMRLDKYLKVSRLIKRRTVANEACDAERVTVNGRVQRASYDVKVGDVISIRFGAKTLTVRCCPSRRTWARTRRRPCTARCRDKPVIIGPSPSYTGKNRV